MIPAYRKLTFLIFVLIFITGYDNIIKADRDQAEITVIYLATEGFIIESGDKKIIIDALPARRFLKKQNISQDIVNSLENAKSPFNDVDIIFVTHAHLDHFDPDLTISYLEANKDAVLVCPGQVFEIIKKLGGYYRVENRIFAVDYFSKKEQTFELKNITFKTLPLPHAPYFVKDTITGEEINRHEDINNLGYLINLNGVSILHTGDNDLLYREEYEKYTLQNESVDIAFVGSLFWGEQYFPQRQDVVDNLIQSEHLVIMHLQMGDDLSHVPRSMREAYPEIVYFTSPLETKIFYK
ncbi:MAG: MBL fold metallo-hydrolase [Bacteroidales bacterium]|nr:MBL fold metallo-hydrolase [Bacteroidales bacterium]